MLSTGKKSGCFITLCSIEHSALRLSISTTYLLLLETNKPIFSLQVLSIELLKTKISITNTANLIQSSL